MDDFLSRFTQDLMGRLGGPLSLRFILQPLMSMIFAIRDGMKDAKTGQPAYFWSFFSDPSHRAERLQQGWKSVGKIFILAIVLDFAYQVIEFQRIYLGEALLTALILALVPYLLLRGPINRIVRMWRGRPASPSSVPH